MTDFRTLTADQFAAEFPHAAGLDGATAYIVATGRPDDRSAIPADMIPEGFEARQVGYTNKSRSIRVVRFALMALPVEDEAEIPSTAAQIDTALRDIIDCQVPAAERLDDLVDRRPYRFHGVSEMHEQCARIICLQVLSRISETPTDILFSRFEYFTKWARRNDPTFDYVAAMIECATAMIEIAEGWAANNSAAFWLENFGGAITARSLHDRFDAEFRVRAAAGQMPLYRDFLAAIDA